MSQGERRRLRYLSGFGNEFASEAVPGALPQGQNSPQRPPLGLYAEQLSGTPFTAPRAENRRSWLYRIRPSAMHPPFAASTTASCAARRSTRSTPSPNRLRWDPLPLPDEPADFIDGLVTMAGNGDAERAMRDRGPSLPRDQADGATAYSTTPTASC